jgi:hypothetical protein
MTRVITSEVHDIMRQKDHERDREGERERPTCTTERERERERETPTCTKSKQAPNTKNREIQGPVQTTKSDGQE